MQAVSITPPHDAMDADAFDDHALDEFEVDEGLQDTFLDDVDAIFDEGATPAAALDAPSPARTHSLEDGGALMARASGGDDRDDETAAAAAEVLRFPREPALSSALLVLRAVHGGDGLDLDVRPSASPVPDNGSQVYVMDRKRKKGRGGPSGEGFAVTFQSAHNSEVFFPEGGDFGVAARPMGRTTKRGGKSELHGYRGKLYTLVKRTSPGSARAIAVVDEALGLVRVWRTADEDAASLGSTSLEDSAPARTRKRARGPEVETVAGSLRVGGDLVVDGNIHGKLVTPEGAADYAEWLPRSLGEPPAPPGTVVRLEGRGSWTRDTRGPGPCLVVSTSPSLAAGVPAQNADKGALIAFMGQVPVRCVGPVAVGDRLYPSGRGDGLAVAQRHAAGDAQALGVAMAAAPGDGATEHVVLAFVRWQAAVRREVAEREGAMALMGYRCALAGLAVASAVVAVVTLIIHLDFFTSMSLPWGFARATLLYLDILQTCLLVALIASFQENVPCRYLLAFVAALGIAVAIADAAHGAKPRRRAPESILAMWCIVSALFHLVALGVAGQVLKGAVRAPKEKKLLDYDALDKEEDPRVARRRRAADVAAGVAVVLAGLWFCLAPAILAVAVVNEHLSRRIDRLEDDVDGRRFLR